jgi:hypothetical protein
VTKDFSCLLLVVELNLFHGVIMHVIISCSAVLLRTLDASHGRFRNLFRHSVGRLWTSDQPVAKASTYTGQHTTERRRQTSMP